MYGWCVAAAAVAIDWETGLVTAGVFGVVGVEGGLGSVSTFLGEASEESFVFLGTASLFRLISSVLVSPLTSAPTDV